MGKSRTKLALSIIWMIISLTMFIFSICAVCGAVEIGYMNSLYSYYNATDWVVVFGDPVIALFIILSFGMLVTSVTLTVVYGIDLKKEKAKKLKEKQREQLIQILKSGNASSLLLEEQPDENVNEEYSSVENMHNNAMYNLKCPGCGTPIEVTSEDVLVCENCGKRYKNPYASH